MSFHRGSLLWFPHLGPAVSLGNVALTLTGLGWPQALATQRAYSRGPHWCGLHTPTALKCRSKSWFKVLAWLPPVVLMSSQCEPLFSPGPQAGPPPQTCFKVVNHTNVLPAEQPQACLMVVVERVLNATLHWVLTAAAWWLWPWSILLGWSKVSREGKLREEAQGSFTWSQQ